MHAVPVPASQLRPTAPHPLVVTTRRVVGTVMSAVAGNDAGLSDVRHYAGGMYGVSATVKLDFAERRADVELWGVPIAGRVAGYGWLSATGDAQESGAVVLDDALQAKLDRRMVRVVNAALDRQADSVTVRVVVPILGEQSSCSRDRRAKGVSRAPDKEKRRGEQKGMGRGRRSGRRRVHACV